MNTFFAKIIFAVLTLGCFNFAGVPIAVAADKPAEKIDLKKVKQDQGPQVQVVQNRTFTKKGRLMLSAFGGTVMTDPFLSVYTVGGKLGYHFSDLFAIQALYWKDFASASSSEKLFQTKTGSATNSNMPKSLYGLEAQWTPIYGKLNLLNSSILYYDFHLGLGLGMRSTESGSTMAYLLNIGQDLFLSQHLVLQIDYRMVAFKQRILEKVPNIAGSPLGGEIANEMEMSNVFTVGFGFLF